MAYDDGDDYNPWDDFLTFRWREFLDWTRVHEADRTKVTLGQLNRLFSKIGELAGNNSSSAEQMRAVEVEKLLSTEQLGNISLKASFSIVTLHSKYRQGGRENIVDAIPLAELDAIGGRQVGRIELSDVVALSSLAKGQAERGDVLEQISIGDLNNVLTNSALNLLSMKDLRKILEQLARV